MDDIKTKVQTQFGAAADAYVTSDVHAQGESLGLLVALLRPQREWRVLDVATGAGHTAIALAPHAAEVVALDLTEPMLAKTAELARQRGLTNVRTQRGDAEALPFPDATFDAVTCRIALHHFPRAERAAAELGRVLKPGGQVGFTDNFVLPDPHEAAYYNEFEKLRDPSHFRVRSIPELHGLFTTAGLEVLETRELSKEFEFHGWADRQHASPATKDTLLAMMRRLPPLLEPFFRPRWTDGTLYFHLWEVVLLARKAR